MVFGQLFDLVDALKLPAKNAEFDVVTSGLVLNFVSDMKGGLLEFLRVLVPGCESETSAFLRSQGSRPDGVRVNKPRDWNKSTQI